MVRDSNGNRTGMPRRDSRPTPERNTAGAPPSSRSSYASSDAVPRSRSPRLASFRAPRTSEAPSGRQTASSGQGDAGRNAAQAAGRSGRPGRAGSSAGSAPSPATTPRQRSRSNPFASAAPSRDGRRAQRGAERPPRNDDARAQRGSRNRPQNPSYLRGNRPGQPGASGRAPRRGRGPARRPQGISLPLNGRARATIAKCISRIRSAAAEGHIKIGGSASRSPANRSVASSGAKSSFALSYALWWWDCFLPLSQCLLLA